MLGQAYAKYDLSPGGGALPYLAYTGMCLLHMELASSENHHKPHNINPRFNNYSI